MIIKTVRWILNDVFKNACMISEINPEIMGKMYLFYLDILDKISIIKYLRNQVLMNLIGQQIILYYQIDQLIRRSNHEQCIIWSYPHG